MDVLQRQGMANVSDKHADIRPADAAAAEFPSYSARIKAALSQTVEALVASGVRRSC